ncbi:alcohol dehydrogenase catalytic domain-containing protein [Sphingobacterium sp. E70]|uniref:alcohol dehydrogenase catalytic domain-containing protein n=1 Tax=Sphingobacterium sp. E70 TaxID=2853439 RepID=UPI0027953F2A|nr:alcohol dehydrogenase catalytic domain-containing protein [Sphingobacterium sp. E70]
MSTFSIKAFGTEAPTADLKQLEVQRRAVTAKDVEIDILYCGVCHSDLHTARNEWGGTIYPNVPGHEIVGRITKVSSDVTKFKVGDLAGVGCMVDSCRECESCKEGLEQYCENGNIQTYNGHDKHLDKQTFGGYSSVSWWIRILSCIFPKIWI